MKTRGKFLGIPYNWQWPTWREIFGREWNKSDHRLFPPKAFSWGYTINFYELLHHRRKLLIGIVSIVVLLSFLAIKQAIHVDKAHQTFENYYSFRGCSKLVKKTDTFGLCKLPSGQTIKLVKFRYLWYLDGDLPICINGYCL